MDKAAAVFCYDCWGRPAYDSSAGIWWVRLYRRGSAAVRQSRANGCRRLQYRVKHMRKLNTIFSAIVLPEMAESATRRSATSSR